jgi:hypothetical protein
MSKPIYEARASRSGRWWSVDVRQLHGVHVQTRRLDQVEDMAREAICVDLQADSDSFDVAVQVDYASLGGLHMTIEQAVRARGDVDKAQSRATEAMRRAVADIRRAGYTARDAGVLLGVSNQRISQIEQQIAGSEAHKFDPATLGDAE